MRAARKTKGPREAEVLTLDEAEKVAKAMTARGYDYATHILVRVLQTCTAAEAHLILNHVGRYAEKVGPTWPEWPWSYGE
jgi:hypothetical protein